MRGCATAAGGSVGDETARNGTFAFVGRDREASLIQAALRHPPAVVLVEGEAGIGKSRLVHEVSTAITAAGGRVLTGLCHPLREPFPYGPVIDALRGAGEWLPEADDLPPSVGALAPLLPDLAVRLPEPLPLASDAHTRRFQLVTGLRAFLAGLSPVVLVIEDAHWIDDATRELLLLLTREMPKRLCLVLTYRNEDLPAGGPLLGSAFRRQPGVSGAAIHLEPLTENAVQELARDALGGNATPELGSVLYQRSEGLPLVAEEDLITLAERGAASETGARAIDLVAGLEDAGVPRGLREAFTERLHNLTPAAKAVVEAAAVLDVPTTEQVLAQMAGLDEDQASRSLSETLRVALLRETEANRYSFRHSLARRVAYEEMPGPLRNRLHRRAIGVLESQSPPPLVQIAHHSLQLGDRQAWLDRAEAAAEQAISLGDSGTAAALLHRILEQPGLASEVRSRAALALASIAVNGVDHLANVTVLRGILADPRLPTTARGEIRLSLGLLLVNHASDRAGYGEIGRAIDELAEQPARAVRAMISMAMDERAGGRKEAWDWAARAEAALASGCDEATAAAVRATKLTVLARQGDPEVWTLVERLPRHADDDEVVRQTARALCNTGELAMELGHDRRAAELMTESRELARRVGFPLMVPYCENVLVQLDVLRGEWTGAEERYGVLRTSYPEFAILKTDEAIVAGQLAAARGQLARAAELFTTAMAYGEVEPQATLYMRAAAGLAAVRLAESAPQDAWTISLSALATLRQADAWARATGLIPVAVEAALVAGRRADAEALVAETESGLRGRDTPAGAAELEVAQGVLLNGVDAKAASVSFESALHLWNAIGRPYEVARAAEQLGSTLSSAGSEDEAATHLRHALDTYESLGATVDVTRLQRTMDHLGLAKNTRRGRRGYGDRLSPRELQVAELVARGATNVDIAQTLVLSQRTVETHVARALKKLHATRATVREALEAYES